MTLGLEVSGAPRLSRGARSIIAARQATGLLALTAAILLGRPVIAQEPVSLTGSWVGTWWIGKYEEPVEVDLTHINAKVVGHVTLWNYPRPGFSDAVSPVRAELNGTVDGNRVELSWAMPDHGQFRAELTILSRTTLFGVGGAGQITTGFELRRSQ